MSLLSTSTRYEKKSNYFGLTLSTGFLLCVWINSSKVERCSSFHCSGSSTFGGSEDTQITKKVAVSDCWDLASCCDRGTNKRANSTFCRRVPAVLEPADDAVQQVGPGGLLSGQVRGPQAGSQVGHGDLADQGPLLRDFSTAQDQMTCDGIKIHPQPHNQGSWWQSNSGRHKMKSSESRK